MSDTDILNQIRTLLGTAPAPPATNAPVRWYVPTDDQTTTFAKRLGWSIHDLAGSRQGTVVACDGTDADAMLYAAFGFWPTGLRYLWSNDNRESADKLCDRIAAAPTAAAANDIIQGAGDPGVETDCAIYLIKTGNVTGGGLAGSPRVGLGGATTVAEAVAILLGQTPVGPGPGPSGK